MNTRVSSFTTLTRPTTTPLVNETLQARDANGLYPNQLLLTCHDDKCIPFTRTYDTELPVPTHDCVRDVLVALANWRKFCDNEQRFLVNADLSGMLHAVLCLPAAPSIEMCCTKWVDKDDPKYQAYPPRIEVDQFNVLHTVEKGNQIKVVTPGWDEYNMEQERCMKWRTANEAQFAYYMQNLVAYDIEDADHTGRVIGSEPARYNPEGVGYDVTHTDYSLI